MNVPAAGLVLVRICNSFPRSSCDERMNASCRCGGQICCQQNDTCACCAWIALCSCDEDLMKF